ncbi:MAG: lectin-like protein, partial [Pseudomonadota bacterium]
MRTLASVVAKPLSFLAFACLGLLAGPSVQAQAVIAGPIVNPNNNHTYYLLEPATWTASEAQAVALGGHLATVRNLAENTWIYNQFSAFSHAGSTARGLWIGLNDVTTEGTYKWSSN